MPGQEQELAPPPASMMASGMLGEVRRGPVIRAKREKFCGRVTLPMWDGEVSQGFDAAIGDIVVI